MDPVPSFVCFLKPLSVCKILFQQFQQLTHFPKGTALEFPDFLFIQRKMYTQAAHGYLSNSAAIMFRLPSTATTSLSWWPTIRYGNTAKWMNDGGRVRAR